MTTAPFAPGNFRYIPGVFQYSGGVAADPGYRLERVMFRSPVPLKEEELAPRTPSLMREAKTPPPMLLSSPSYGLG